MFEQKTVFVVKPEVSSFRISDLSTRMYLCQSIMAGSPEVVNGPKDVLDTVQATVWAWADGCNGMPGLLQRALREQYCFFH